MRRRESEGLSYARLARETGIPVGTLAWWAHRERKEHERSAACAARAEFVEVIPSGDGDPTEAIKVRLPGGIVLLVPCDADGSYVARLLSALQTC